MRLEAMRYGIFEFGGIMAQPAFGPVRDPIFIVGTGRCGTTLLYRVLKSHPSILAFPSEANELWHPALYPYAKRKIEAHPYFWDPLSYCMISRSHWPPKHKQRILRILSGFHAIFGRGRTLLVGSAMIVYLLPEIVSIFPEAKIIHISRSGPSVVESFHKKEWHKYKARLLDPSLFKSKIAAYWNNTVLFMESLKRKYSQRSVPCILDVRYEALCDHTEETLDEIGSFLDMDPTDVTFPLKQIRNMNFKVGNIKNDKEWEALLDLMKDGMRLKDYC